MQPGQREVKHWAFKDPPQREGLYEDDPPIHEEYRRLEVRVVELHPLTVVKHARTSFAGQVCGIQIYAITVVPVETSKSKKVSIWGPGWTDTFFGVRLSGLMFSKGIADNSVPMSRLADHPNVRLNYYGPGIGSRVSEMH